MENASDLQEEVYRLQEQLAAKSATISERDQKISVLTDQIRHLLSKRFGPSSEKTAVDQLGLFNEAEELTAEVVEAQQEECVTVEEHKRKKKPRVGIPDHLPREEIIYDLAEEDKYCPHDGTPLKPFGSEDHEQIEIIPAQINALVHKRLKYTCPCCNQHIVTAEKPKQPIEKSIAGPGLLAYIATQKYADALPLYRQTELFKRIGIEIDRTNMANWMIKCGQLVQPLINLLIDRLHMQPYIHMDETTLQVLDEPGKTAQSKSYMWVMASTGEEPVRIFHYADNRGQRVPLELLSTDNQAIVVDGYEWYQKACDNYGITRLGCWAHARRKFKEAQALQKKGKTGKSDQALAFINKLYAIERKTKDDPPDKRHQVRQEMASPILENLKTWLDKSLLNVAPKTKLGKALVYLNNQWDRLVGYLEDGCYPIDNNAAERAIRPFAIGRKNWMFSKSQAGAKASANLYSLVETAKANGLNSYEYLKLIFKELPNAKCVEDIERLLPWQVQLG